MPISKGLYKDEVLCDEALMQAGNLLLGRRRQYNRKAIHDGLKNTYAFVKGGKTFILNPLTPHQFYEEQRKMREEKD